MKVLRILAVLSVLLLAAVVTAVFYLGSRIDGIVEKAIETHGSELSGTAVEVASVNFSFKEGRGTIRGLTIANPPGFPPGDAFSLGEVTLRLDLSSVREDTLVVEEAVIRGPVVRTVVTSSGETNIGAIAKHVRESIPPEEEKAEREPGGEPRLAIGSFIFEEGRIDADTSAVGGDVKSVDLPPLRLEGLGGPAGASPAVLGGEILLAYSEAVLKAAARAGVRSYLEKEVEGLLDEGIGEEGKGLIRSLLGGEKK